MNLSKIAPIFLLSFLAASLTSCVSLMNHPGYKNLGVIDRPTLNSEYKVEVSIGSTDMISYFDTKKRVWDYSEVQAVVEVENTEPFPIAVAVAKHFANSWDVERLVEVQPKERRVVVEGMLRPIGISVLRRGQYPGGIKLSSRVFLRFKGGRLPDHILLRADKMNFVL